VTASVDPRAGTEPVTAEGDGILFTGLRWRPSGGGPGTGRRAVLLHGVQSSAATMARTARALAADGWDATALDMPGHGTTRWLDGAEDDARYERANVVRLVATAVAAVAEVADRPTLIGHSWGADTALAIAAGGARLERAVLIDTPAMTPTEAAAMAAADVAELRPGDLAAALEVVQASGSIRNGLDVVVKAEALATISPLTIEAVYGADGAWQPQIDARRWRDAGGTPPLAIIAADPDAGGLIPWPVIGELRTILGDELVHVLTCASHSPQRTDFGRFWTLLRRLLD